MLEQSFSADSFEVIVVNDSGRSLAEASWLHSERVQLINTNRRERSFARNVGAAVANGKFLHFLDDDDWLMPNALQHFWELAASSDAGWLYGVSQLVDRQGQPVLQLRHKLKGNCFVQTVAGEWIPLQASLIRADLFFRIGGFNPLITGPEDIDLLRRIALHSDLAETQNVVAFIARGEQGSTTDYDRHTAMSRWARESVLSLPGVFTRMRESADSGYWHGRALRAYLTSTLWNMRRGRVLIALSRATYAAMCFTLAGKHLLSRNYWWAVLAPYISRTFLEGSRQPSG